MSKLIQKSNIKNFVIILTCLTLLLGVAIIGQADAKVKQANNYNYIGNSNSMKFHYPECRWAKKISAKNKVYFDSKQEALDSGYVPCKVCKP